MRIWIDAQLSPRIAAWISDGFDFEARGETLGLIEEAEAFDEKIRVKPAIEVERADDAKNHLPFL